LKRVDRRVARALERRFKRARFQRAFKAAQSLRARLAQRFHAIGQLEGTKE
jgi:hypothetical protein